MQSDRGFSLRIGGRTATGYFPEDPDVSGPLGEHFTVEIGQMKRSPGCEPTGVVVFVADVPVLRTLGAGFMLRRGRHVPLRFWDRPRAIYHFVIGNIPSQIGRKLVGNVIPVTAAFYPPYGAQFEPCSLDLEEIALLAEVEQNLQLLEMHQGLCRHIHTFRRAELPIDVLRLEVRPR